jgi:hypothetical protein
MRRADPLKWQRQQYNWLHLARRFGFKREYGVYDPASIERTLPKALKKVLMSLRALPSLEGISAAWRLAVGPELARRSAPFMFKSGVLFVNVAHPIVTMELHRILPVVALKLGPDWGVTRIILRVAEPKAESSSATILVATDKSRKLEARATKRAP